MATGLIVTLLGAEGAGKSTLCDVLADRLGAKKVIVPEWPSFDSFLSAPDIYAFQNQREAMMGCLAAYNRALSMSQSTLVLLEQSPERIHLVYSSLLRELGYLTGEEWRVLQDQYECALALWPRHYIYLYAPDDVIAERLRSRDRKEDVAWNQVHASRLRARWQMLVAGTWREARMLLQLRSDGGIDAMGDEAIRWIVFLRGH